MGFRPLVFTELGMSKLRFLFREVAEISAFRCLVWVSGSGGVVLVG